VTDETRSDLASLDFEMLPEPQPLYRSEIVVVAVEHGHRLISATVEWHKGSHSVFLSMESDGGLGFTNARRVLQTALINARSAIGRNEEQAAHGYLAHGPQFTTGRAFAERLSKAIADGSAHFYDA
jgi:hypothetical protein